MSALLAASGPKAMWYLTRGSGVVALLLLTAAVVLGILHTIRWRGERWPRFLVGGLHKNVTLLGVVFVVVHVMTTVLDGYAPIHLQDAVIPFISAYRPIWLGLGAVAFDLLLALVITSLLRARVGMRMWRAVHWLAYASWPVALVHGLGTGSDGRFGWLAFVAFGSAALVAAAALVRVARAAQTTGIRVTTASAVVLAPLLIFVWYQSGPAQHGWAARAGTPASLLHAPAAQVSARAVSAPSTSFSGRLDGRLSQTRANANGIITIDISGRVSGSVKGSLRVSLYGAPTAEGGVALTSSRVVFVPAQGSVLTGSVVQLEGTHVTASLASSSGTRTNLSLLLQINANTGQVAGSVRGSPA